MVRSLCLKLFVVCVSLVSLSGSASAQTLTRQSSFTDEVLEQMFRQIDANVQVQLTAEGNKLFLFKVNRGNGVSLPMGVIVAPNTLTVCVMIKDPFLPLYSLPEINRRLEEANRQLKPVVVNAQPMADGKVAFFATLLIDRSLADGDFATVWNAFLKVATDLRGAVNQ